MIEKYKLGPQEALLKLLVNGNFTLLSADPHLPLIDRLYKLGSIRRHNMGFTVIYGENALDDHV